MSKKSNQCREDQYDAKNGKLGGLRSYKVGSKLSSGAGKDPIQPNKRGDQGTKA